MMKKKDEIIKKLIKQWVINPAQARALETFITTTLASLLVLIAENINILFQWEIIEFKNALMVFGGGVIVSIQMWIQKYMRDKAKDLLTNN